MNANIFRLVFCAGYPSELVNVDVDPKFRHFLSGSGIRNLEAGF